jgi:plastocyanin domain-containing protein
MPTHYLVIELAFVLVGLATLWLFQRRALVREIAVRFDGDDGPPNIAVREGETLRLKLFRTIESRCTREIVFPSLNIRRTLPVGAPVTIDLRPRGVGPIEFFCGMKMLRGTIEVRPQI